MNKIDEQYIPCLVSFAKFIITGNSIERDHCVGEGTENQIHQSSKRDVKLCVEKVGP